MIDDDVLKASATDESVGIASGSPAFCRLTCAPGLYPAGVSVAGKSRRMTMGDLLAAIAVDGTYVSP